MPQCGGLDVLTHIQDSQHNSGAAIIMITSDSDMETAVAARRNGCHDYLTKGTITPDQPLYAMAGATQTASVQQNAVAQAAHRQEVICQELTAALQDREVQGTVIALFEDQYTQAVMKRQTAWAMQDHSKLDALLANLDDDDEFILR